MKKIILLLGSFFLLAGSSIAQSCPTGNAGTTGEAARFANGGQIYLEWPSEAAANAVWSNLTTNNGSITLSGTADNTGSAIDLTIPVPDLRRPSGNPFRIRSNFVIENGGGNFTGTVTFNLGTSTLECVYAAGVLPITLSEFSAKPASKSVMINWKTVAELNNDFMAVERSADGRTFHEIGRQLGAGYSVSLQEYTLEDTNPVRGANYYRLRQVDFDGTTSYSHVVQTSFNGTAHDEKLDIYPTLIDGTGELNIDLSAFSAGDIQLAIYQMNGQLVEQYRSNGGEKMVIPVGNFEQGFYMIKVVDGHSSATGRFVKI